MLLIILKDHTSKYPFYSYFTGPEFECDKVWDKLQKRSFDERKQLLRSLVYKPISPITPKYRQKRIDFYNRIQNLKINGQSIREFYSYDNISMLQMISERFSVHMNAWMDEALELCELLPEQLKQNKTKSLIVIGDISATQKSILNTIANSFSNTLQLAPFPVTKKNNSAKNFTQQEIQQYLRSKPLNHEEIRNQVLFLCTPKNARLDQNDQFYELYYDAYQNYFKKQKTPYCRLILPSFLHQVLLPSVQKNPLNYINKQLSHDKPYGNTLFVDQFALTKDTQHNETFQFIQKSRNLLASSEFISAFTWNEIDVFSPLKQNWQHLFCDNIEKEIIPCLQTADNLLRRLQPKALITVYEVGWNERSLIIQAQKLNIPTIALQHGAFADHRTYYRFSNTSYQSTTGHTIPTKTIVWGNHYRNVLTELNDYPQNCVEAIGCDWRLLRQAKKDINSVNSPWMNSEKDKVLLLTTPALVPNLINQLCKVFPAPTTQFLIKPHPVDKNHTDIVKDFQQRGYEAASTSLLYETLISADYICSPINSSVTFEALFFQKPIIYFNPFDYIDPAKQTLMDNLQDIFSIKNRHEITIPDVEEINFKTYLNNVGYLPLSLQEFEQRFEKIWKEVISPTTNSSSTPPPTISIVIPANNAEKYLAETLRSLKAQLTPECEVVIINDGSTDRTEDIVKQNWHPSFRYFHKHNSGAPDTRNACIKYARGVFLLWLDADDLLKPNVISTYLKFIPKYPDVDVFYGNVRKFGELDTDLQYEDWYDKNKKLLSESAKHCSVPNPGTLVRKELYQKIGDYKREYKRAHDYEFWSRAALSAKFKHIGIYTADYRIHDNNISGNMHFNSFYESAIIKSLLLRHTKKELFPDLDLPAQEAEANFRLANTFCKWKDWQTAALFAGFSLKHHHTEKTLALLNDIYHQMGHSKNFFSTSKKF